MNSDLCDANYASVTYTFIDFDFVLENNWIWFIVSADITS